MLPRILSGMSDAQQSPAPVNEEEGRDRMSRLTLFGKPIDTPENRRAVVGIYERVLASNERNGRTLPIEYEQMLKRLIVEDRAEFGKPRTP